MAYKYNRTPRKPSFVAALRARQGLLKDFPIDTTVQWQFGGGQMTVTGHDKTNGRVITKEGSYNPQELIIVSKKEKKD